MKSKSTQHTRGTQLALSNAHGHHYFYYLLKEGSADSLKERGFKG